jgi:crotonobetainyl-CoA:carnitine CoA-transferase CaiB-like acyl-CoA transferase
MTALAGVESTVGYPDGRIVPQIASAVGDVVAAYFGNLLVLSALYEREKTGLGAVIDMSQTEASTAMAGLALAEYGLTGEVPRPRGNRDPRAVPHGIYPTAGADVWVALAVWTDEEWQALCTALDLPDDVRTRFAKATNRLAAPDEVDVLVSERTVLEKRDELFVRLQAAGLSCTPVLDTFEADEIPALRERGLWRSFEHQRLGEIRMTEIPWKFDHLELRRRGLAEPLGASTARVLEELLSADPADIEEWRRAGALD